MDMSAEPSSVDCPECGESFDPTKSNRWCTNPECGKYKWEPSDETGASDEPGESSTGGESGGSDGSPTVTCAACGEEVPDENFCKECRHELGTSPEPVDEGDEPETTTGSGGGDEPETTTGSGGGDEPDDTDEPLTTCPSCGEDVQSAWSACPFCEENLDQHRSTEDETETDGTDGTDGKPDAGPVSTDVPEEIVVEVGDVEIEAVDGETVGRKVRSAHVRAGGDEDEAQFIHREHVRFELEDGSFTLVNEGRNGTQLNGETLELDERVTVEDGDEVTFSDVATGTIRVE